MVPAAAHPQVLWTRVPGIVSSCHDRQRVVIRLAMGVAS